MTYGHAHLLDGPLCACGRPVQVVQEDGAQVCARCALVAVAPSQ